MDGHLSASSKRRNCVQQLALCKLSKLICFLLIFLIITFVTIHSYLSSINVDGLQTHKSRSQLAHHEDLDNLKSSDLKGQIEELRRIKASVNNELRDLESKRLSLQTEINNYKTQVEAFRMQQETLEKNVQQSKLNLEQLKLEETELSNRFMPILKAPEQILLSDEGMRKLSSVHMPSYCRMHSCFDYSKCMLVGGFPVFVYKLEQSFSNENLNEFIRTSVSHAFTQSSYITRQPEKACVFIAVFGETFTKITADVLQKQLTSLDHWNGDGRNHVLIDVTRSPSHVDLFSGVNTGRALVVQSSFIDTVYRPSFDIIIPPSLGNTDGPVWSDLPSLSPVRRQFLLSFSGQFKDPGNVLNTVSQKQENDNLNIVNNNIVNNPENGKTINSNDVKSFKVRSLLYDDKTTNGKSTITENVLAFESSIVQNLKRIQTESKEKVFLKFVCDKNEVVGISGEWCLCDSPLQRAETLRQSIFSIIISPANYSIVSTAVFQIRFYEALKNGAVPVILGDYAVLPFSELIDWAKAVIFLPKARVTEVHFMLRTLSDNDVMEYKWHGRLFWQSYFGTTNSIISTTLAVLRTRLQIPARPVTEEPSVSSISNFIPVAQHLGVNPEDETDEMLGPVEPPFASAMFTQNFTSQTLRDVFNKPGDPFHLFPFDPFVKVLPSDAKFKGSGYGFRPVNKGEGGSGKEFSEALGGNHPREQFTMVMLTYERSDVLIQAVTRLKGLPYLNKVIVVWNNPSVPSENLGWPDIGVPVVVVKMKKNSLNNRFLPFEAIETEAVLSIDDDSHLRHDEIVFGFRVWREERDRIVGFPGRYHAWDVDHNSWLYNSNYSCEMSMVLTGAAFFHKYYAYLYTYSMPEAIREKVDEYMNCEDIAMNFLVSHITRKPPVKVTSRWTFRCPGCPQKLAEDTSHFGERHKCINFFMEVYGYMPLLYTQFRVDSILFKTRISHDKQKCFKYI